MLRRIGYTLGNLTLDVSPGDTVRATYAMKLAAQTLAAVNVRDTLTSTSPLLRDFERRVANHAGSATYITRSEIERRKPSRTTDLLRRVSSISIADSSGVLMAVTRRLQKPVVRRGAGGLFADLADCPLQVAIDGQLKEWGYAINSIPPEEIHGIEIYPGPATIPAEYASMRRDANCGLLIIWTRRDKD
jgi:outer membrane receptor protein involved in Fe transport